jgi:CSLREA domain-containing protein
MKARWIVAAGCALAAVGAAPASAATFTVNSTVDAVDANPGDGICATATGACTLRAASQEYSADQNTDVIELPAGTYTLSLAPTADDVSGGDIDLFGNGVVDGAGPDATIIDAAGVDRVLDVQNGLEFRVRIEGVTLRGGDTAGDGGGLVANNVSGFQLNDVDVTDNRAGGDGGGIALANVDSMFSRNVLVARNSATNGGGVAAAAGADLDFFGTTIAGNTALVDGGGVHALVGYPDDLNLSNATISGNTAGERGGGVFARLVGEDPRPTAGSISFSTIVRNTAPIGGGLFLDGPFTLVGSIVGENETANCELDGVTIVQSMSDDMTCGAATVVPDLRLGPLAENGGPLPTHALLTGSPAIDQFVDQQIGPNVYTCSGWDARGVSRTENAPCDLGAFEREFTDDRGPACAIVRVGTNRRDLMAGSPRGDDLRGRGGNDEINGYGGDDCLDGGEGDDFLNGSFGSDVLKGGSGADIGNGGPSDDLVLGGSGNDGFGGGEGDDVVDGQGGNDFLTGNLGEDLLIGGSGNDRIDAYDGDPDVVRCGPGRDQATVDTLDETSGCEVVNRSPFGM